MAKIEPVTVFFADSATIHSKWDVWIEIAQEFTFCFRNFKTLNCSNFIYSLSAEEKLWLTVEKIIHESSERLAILVVTQPFQVLAVRCMAQFVGGENKYNGILSGFGEIYRENGILGM